MLFENSTSFSINTTSKSSQEESLSPEMKVIYYVLIILSALGCIFNLIATFLLKLHGNVLGKMTIFLSINDLIFIIALILGIFGKREDIPFLVVFSSLTMWASWTGSIFWVCCFGHALYTSVKSGEQCLTNSLFSKYVCSSFIVSVVSMVTEYLSVYELILSLSIFAGTITTSIVYCSACYITVFKILRQNQEKVPLELLLYPLILIICEIAILLYAIMSTFIVEHDKSMLVTNIGVLIFLSRGIWNSLAYGLSSKIRSGFKALCKPPKNKKLLESQFSIITYSDTSYNSRSRGVTSLEAPGFVLVYGSLTNQDSPHGPLAYQL